MEEQLIQELNQMKYLSCSSILAQEQTLQITVCGVQLISIHPADEMKEHPVIAKLFDETVKEIVPDPSVLYQITFDGTISYEVLNESYSCWDDYETWEYGNLFRVYTKSKFLDFISETTFAKEFTDSYRHYGILCLDHIIHVISEDPPKIKKISKIGKEM